VLITRKLGFLVVLLSFFCHAEARELKLKQLPQNSLLSSSYISHIEQLDNGYLLFSTAAGSRLFDGTQFIELNVPSGEEFSPMNADTYMTLQDSRGHIWFATSLGLFKLDPQTGQITRFANDPNNANSLVDDNIREIAEDTAGNLWFGTLNGISRFDPVTRKFTHFTESDLQGDNKNLGRGMVFIQENESIMWVGTNHGLFFIDQKKNQITRAKGQAAEASITSATKTRSNQIWFGSEGNGIFVFDPATREFVNHTTTNQNKIKLKTNNVWSLFQDNAGLIWIGYWSSGLTVYDPLTQQNYWAESRRHDYKTLPDRSIEMFTQDESGLIWIATPSGAATFDLQTIDFQYTYHIVGDENSINEASIYAIVEDNQGFAWLGTGNGLERLKVEDGSITHFYHQPDNAQSITDGPIWKLTWATDQLLMMGTDYGIDVLDISTGVTKHYRDLYTNRGPAFQAAFYDFEPAGDSWFYVTGSDASVYLFNPVSGQRKLVFDAIQMQQIHGVEYFSSLKKDHHNNLWIGSTLGLIKLNLDSGDTTYFAASSTTHKISDNHIYGLSLDGQGDLWVATGNGGINKISTKHSDNPTIKIFTTEQGMPSNIIFNLLSEDNNIMWFTTEKHFGFINTLTDEINVFSLFTSDSKHFVEGGIASAKNDYMYLGGNSLIRFNPDELEESLYQPPVRFTGVRRLHKTDQNFSPLAEKQIIELFPEDTLVTFSFASLDYANPRANKYRYKLEGHDKNWLNPGNENKASYTHLPPGKFILKVQGSNRDGKWSDDISEMTVIVHPPFYRSLLAYFLYFSTALLIAFYFIRDRREKRRKELYAMATIRESEARLRDVLWGSGDVLWRWNLKTNEISSTDNLNLEGAGREEITDLGTLMSSIHPEDREQVNDMIDRHLKGEEDYYEAQFRVLGNESNSWRWVMSRGRIVERDDDGAPLMVAGTRKNIDDIKKTEKQLRYLANYDQLTRLPNRSLFHEHLNHALEMAKRFDEKIALLFFDLDGFKLINDSMGHAVGDQLLQSVALRLTKILRSTDSCARLGGDEFAVIIERIKDKQEVIPTLERVLEEISRPFELNDQSVVTSVSIGVASFPEDGNMPALLLKHADIAMYEAKRNGKKNYRFYHPQMNALLVKRLDMENELKTALAEDQFETFFQPRVSVKDNRPKGFEALIRWRHPQRGLVSPAEFIPIAEETGQILDLGDWVLRDACRQGAMWYQKGWRGFVSVNIAALQFQQSDLVSSVEQALNETNMPAQCLELEITEGTLIKDIERTRNIILCLKKIGVKIALDDFGTGYSSLSYLQQLPIDALKIDRSFINQIPHSSKSARLCKAIINMAHSLDLEVVAEGIEENEQLAFLKDANCEEYQGYLFGKPIPASEIEIG